mmetsp:Transcript_43007/g.86958  ORF Transcript_43007/g.86958 Transcript_43007/m.86958 type:complete len:283 (-) Transcript_43007:109-957(-)
MSIVVDHSKPPDLNLVVTSLCNAVLTIRFNDPRRKNAWSGQLLDGLTAAFNEAASDDRVKVVILTGTGDYYCSGVDFVSSFPLMRPSLLVEHLRQSNQKLFETFLLFPKPIIVAANGPAIGASVTSASLCDAIIASPEATFHTPFDALGIVPEGCSSYWFKKVMGPAAALRMLGQEGWKPTAQEARDIGLVREVVTDPCLMTRAQEIAESWASADKRRNLVEKGELSKLLQVNAVESKALAEAFLSRPFLESQHRAAQAKGKTKLAAFFWVLLHSQFLWSRL